MLILSYPILLPLNMIYDMVVMGIDNTNPILPEKDLDISAAI